MRLLPVAPAWRLAEGVPEQRWLVTDLWSEEAVGIVGGEPKCCKSFLALDLAVAVAAGVPCLRRYAVPHSGRVLLYAAEDALATVRRRLEGIAAAAGVELADLDIQVITAPTLRLDLDADRRSLALTVAKLQPRLLILDPFVRLHRIDENASERAGQALRGSSEFHAWGDSNLYLRREGDTLTLTVEHRAAPSQKPMRIELVEAAEALALQVADRSEPATPAPSSLDERIASALADAASPLPFGELRSKCRVRSATLYERLAALTATGRIVKAGDGGYRLVGA